MYKILESFRRHYHKTKEVAWLLGPSASTFQLTFENGLLKGQHSLPNEPVMIRFIVLMRRFLDKNDMLYYQKIWSLLQKNFGGDLPSGQVKSINLAIRALQKGFIKFNVDGRTLTPEDIYYMLSEGIYFNHDVEAWESLQQLRGHPLIDPMLWSQFCMYSLGGFQVVNLIFDAFLTVRKGKMYQEYLASIMPDLTQCIYCLDRVGTFHSEEHVFPESLGNQDMILPKGFVCDKCNNEVLAQLDKYLLEFDPIAFLRVLYVPYTKKGKLPKANFQNMTMEKTSPRSIKVVAKDKTASPINITEFEDGRIQWTQNTRGKSVDMKMLGRSIYKIALGTIAFKQGISHALDERFNLVRSFILGETGFPNNLVMRKTVVPEPNVRIDYFDLEDGMPVVINIMGIYFIVNLDTRLTIEPNAELKALNFEVYPLSD